MADIRPRVVEDREVLLARGDERQRGQLRCLLDGRDGPDPYRIDLHTGGHHFTATGPDVFEALVRLRLQLEPDGWSIAVQGARRDTFPSWILRDMSSGVEVYALRMGHRNSEDDIVPTLADAEVDQLGTVEEQAAHMQAWFAEIQGRRR